VPVHVPFVAVIVFPSCAIPEIVGGAVFDGGIAAGPTVAVDAEFAAAVPASFDAVTMTTRVDPTSSSTITYV